MTIMLNIIFFSMGLSAGMLLDIATTAESIKACDLCAAQGGPMP